MAEEKNNTAKINQSKQEKLKNQTESQNKDDELKTKSPAELRKLLSNKNSDYVFRLQKELQAQGKMTLEEAENKVNELFPNSSFSESASLATSTRESSYILTSRL